MNNSLAFRVSAAVYARVPARGARRESFVKLAVPATTTYWQFALLISLQPCSVITTSIIWEQREREGECCARFRVDTIRDSSRRVSIMRRFRRLEVDWKEIVLGKREASEFLLGEILSPKDLLMHVKYLSSFFFKFRLGLTKRTKN